MFRKTVGIAMVLATLGCGAAQAGDHTGALLGGLAVGAAGGAILGAALSQPHPAPVYVAAPPPSPRTVYVAPPPRTVYVQPVRVSPYDDQMAALHGACDAGDRHACIRFGVLIGEHRERVADWRRMHPDYFVY